jgi:hypothetical protein
MEYTTVTTLPYNDDKYLPLTTPQYLELKEFLSNLGSNLPTDKLSYVWNTYNAVRNMKENQPCGCGSAAGMWRRAIDELSAWVKEKE